VKGIRITHLIFVDDIILFGIGSLTEWGMFKEVFDFFSNATRMAYNTHKSQFLEARWSREE